jgi:hypothetical protein
MVMVMVFVADFPLVTQTVPIQNSRDYQNLEIYLGVAHCDVQWN